MNAPQFAAKLIEAAASFTGIDPSEITGSRRLRNVSEARWACWLVMRQRGITYMEIGKLFNKDHSAVIYGIKVATQHQGDREADFRELCRVVAATANDSQPHPAKN